MESKLEMLHPSLQGLKKIFIQLHLSSMQNGFISQTLQEFWTNLLISSKLLSVFASRKAPSLPKYVSGPFPDPYNTIRDGEKCFKRIIQELSLTSHWHSSFEFREDKVHGWRGKWVEVGSDVDIATKTTDSLTMTRWEEECQGQNNWNLSWNHEKQITSKKSWSVRGFSSQMLKMANIVNRRKSMINSLFFCQSQRRHFWQNSNFSRPNSAWN